MKDFNASDWEKIDLLFQEAMDLSSADRDLFFLETEKQYPEYSGLIKKMVEEGDALHPMLYQSAAGIWQDLTSDVSLVGSKIGVYRITGLLGSGAMGSVFTADREEQFQQTVALKLIRPGLYNEKFTDDFKKERQILANLQHPNIATLFDGGLGPDNRPWFTMELVKGQKITEYCADPYLSLKDKINIFLQVCEAMQYAHSRLIVHLDLKPGNILVNQDGLVKVLDFGVAQSFSPSVSADQSEGDSKGPVSYQFTLGYAAPEQLQGLPVGTPADIYAAGTLLYEILSGTHPFQDTLTDSHALSKAILSASPRLLDQQEEPPRNNQGIAGTLHNEDLEAICRKALAKKPEDRYKGMEQLADDLKAWQNNFPVKSRVAPAGYVFGKFLKRNRKWAASLLIGLLVLSVTVTGYTLELKKKRDIAVKEAAKSNQIMKAMLNIFQMADPNLGTGKDITAVALLQQGTEQMEKDLIDQPDVLSTLLRQMASAFNALGVYPQADTLSLRAIGLSREAFPDNPLEIAPCYVLRASVMNNMGEYDSSLQYLLKASGIYKDFGMEDGEEGLTTLYEISVLYYNMGNFMLADSFQQVVYNIHKENIKAPDLILAEDLMAMGINQRKLGNYQAADSFLMASYRMKQELFDSPHPDLAYTLNFLSSSKQDMGDFEGALPLARESLRQYYLVMDSAHPECIAAQSNLARIFSSLQFFDSSFSLYERSISFIKKTYGPDHFYVGVMLDAMGNIKLRQKNYAEAEILLLKGYAISKDIYENGNVREAIHLSKIGLLYYETKRYTQALSWLQKAYEINKAGYPEGHDKTGLAAYQYSLCLRALQKNEIAAPLLELALTSLESMPEKYEKQIQEIRQILPNP